LLTSVGLLALLPYVLKRGWKHRSGNLAVDSGYASVMAAVEAFDTSPVEKEPESLSVPVRDLEELLGQMFSLRMTVSDATAEIQDTRDELDRGSKSSVEGVA
jgi:hypothetical protein